MWRDLIFISDLDDDDELLDEAVEQEERDFTFCYEETWRNRKKFRAKTLEEAREMAEQAVSAGNFFATDGALIDCQLWATEGE